MFDVVEGVVVDVQHEHERGIPAVIPVANPCVHQKQRLTSYNRSWGARRDKARAGLKKTKQIVELFFLFFMFLVVSSLIDRRCVIPVFNENL